MTTYASALTGTMGMKPKNQLRKAPLGPRENVMASMVCHNHQGEHFPPTGGIKLTITNIDAGLGEDGIRELLNQKIRKTCQIERCFFLIFKLHEQVAVFQVECSTIQPVHNDGGRDRSHNERRDKCARKLPTLTNGQKTNLGHFDPTI